jgi:Zn-dependent protease with chaperone function
MTLLLVPVLVSVALGLVAGPLERRLPPSTAARLLTASALVSALATGFVLGVAGFVALSQIPVVAAVGQWSRAVLRHDRTPQLLGAVAGIVVIALLGRAVRGAVEALRHLWAAEATCRRLGPGADGLVVTDDSVPDAYAVQGLRGRIVVSRAMLSGLPADERRVLLAHEASHLRHHHHVYLQLTQLAAAANPALRQVTHAVHAAVERWADEDAAADVGDRALAARALARASLLRHGSAAPALMSRPASALAAVTSGVVSRTQALLRPAPRPRRALVVSTTALVLCAAVAAGVTAHDTEHRFELARHVLHHAS